MMEEGIHKITIPTKYRCRKCNAVINKVVYKFPTHKWYRWTYTGCDRDYGYDTERPLQSMTDNC